MIGRTAQLTVHPVVAVATPGELAAPEAGTPGEATVLPDESGTPLRLGSAAVAGDAVLQTLPCTGNSGASALLVLTALLVLGGDSLASFAFALVPGIVAGTVSTVSVAVPLAVAPDRRRPPPRADGAVASAHRTPVPAARTAR